jgi:hypothetical protein
MKYFGGLLFAFLFLLLGLAIGFKTGRTSGFETGSQWALMQADILAREAGLSMPVVLDAGTFRVIMKQPRGLYRRAWRLADEHETATPARQEKTGARTEF